ncbi:hypothetical protein D3C86_1743470 [compost metagenome]
MFSVNTTDIRNVFTNGRATATIVKNADGKYTVIKLYENAVQACDSYTEAREAALAARTTSPDRHVSDVKERRFKEAV